MKLNPNLKISDKKGAKMKLKTLKSFKTKTATTLFFLNFIKPLN